MSLSNGEGGFFYSEQTMGGAEGVNMRCELKAGGLRTSGNTMCHVNAIINVFPSIYIAL